MIRRRGPRQLGRAAGLAWVFGLVWQGILPSSAYALGVRFADLSPTEGKPFDVRVELLEDPGVVSRVEVELRSEGQSWSRREAQFDGLYWVARFPAQAVGPAGSLISLRASGFGARAGLVFLLAHDEPFELPVLTQEAAARRQGDLARASEALQSPDSSVFAGKIAVQAGAGRGARLRVVLGAEIPLSSAWSSLLLLSLGPRFSVPGNQPDRGSIRLGIETGLRRWAHLGPGHPWRLLGGPRIGVDLALPGVDPFAGIEAGASYQLAPEAFLELILVSDVGIIETRFDPLEVAFSAGIRVGLSLGNS